MTNKRPVTGCLKVAGSVILKRVSAAPALRPSEKSRKRMAVRQEVRCEMCIVVSGAVQSKC
jgi:hypothetical protein